MKLRLITQSRYVHFHIQPVPDAPVMCGTVRPLSRAELVAFDREHREKKDTEREDAWDTLIAACVLTWDVTKDDAGTIAPINKETLGQLPRPYWLALESHIMGYAYSPECEIDSKKS